jgi:hypothetical protein
MNSPAEQSTVRTTVRTILGSFLLGAASGMRSTVGLAAVIVQGDGDVLPSALSNPRAKPAAGLAVAIELVLDKMPFTGSRLEPAGLAGRFVFAGAAAGLAAQRKGRPVVLSALIAVATSGLIAKVTHDLRAKLAEKMPDFVVAVDEDLTALVIAVAGSRC